MCCIGGSGNLEQHVTDEERSVKERELGFCQMQGLAHATGFAKANVHAIEVGQAVGDEGEGENPSKSPAACCCIRGGRRSFKKAHVYPKVKRTELSLTASITDRDYRSFEAKGSRKLKSQNHDSWGIGL